MGSIALFRLDSGQPQRLDDSPVVVEKHLQSLVEKHLDVYLGVTFLATEFRTGTVHGGRIDTLGIDENNVPVIIEYKRSVGENVINQGLFYLDWLMDHKGDFSELVRKVAGEERAKEIDWASPRVICVAGDFTRYDEHAVQQIGRSIELLKYRRYGDDLLLFETVGRESVVKASNGSSKTATSGKGVDTDGIEYKLQASSEELRTLFGEVIEFLESFEDATRRDNKLYVAFKRIKNFACVEVAPQLGVVTLYVKVDPSSIELEDGFTRDLRQVGHWGTGDLGISIRNREDLEKAKPLVEVSYDGN